MFKKDIFWTVKKCWSKRPKFWSKKQLRDNRIIPNACVIFTRFFCPNLIYLSLFVSRNLLYRTMQNFLLFRESREAETVNWIKNDESETDTDIIESTYDRTSEHTIITFLFLLFHFILFRYLIFFRERSRWKMPYDSPAPN